MEPEVTTEQLRFLCPLEAECFRVDLRIDADTWKPMTADRGTSGPRVKYFEIPDQLTVEWIARTFGAEGVFRVRWIRGTRKKVIGTTHAFRIAPDWYADDGEPQALPSQPTAPLPEPELAGPSAAARVAASLNPRAIAALSPEQLTALLYSATGRDDTPMGLLERIAGMYNSQQQVFLAMVQADADRRVALAQAETERARVESQTRADVQIEQTRMFYERLSGLEAASREREREVIAAAREDDDGATAEELAELRGLVAQLAEGNQQAAQQLAAYAEEGASNAQIVGQLIGQLAPQLIQAIAQRIAGAPVAHAPPRVVRSNPVVTPPPVGTVTAVDFTNRVRQSVPRPEPEEPGED